MAYDLWDPADHVAPARRSGRGDLAATIALLVISVLAGLLLSFILLLEQMAVAGCSATPGQCDFGLMAMTTWITPAALTLSVAATIAGLVARARSGWRAWWIPLLGLGVIIVAFVVASLLVFQATHP